MDPVLVPFEDDRDKNDPERQEDRRAEDVFKVMLVERWRRHLVELICAEVAAVTRSLKPAQYIHSVQGVGVSILRCKMLRMKCVM